MSTFSSVDTVLATVKDLNDTFEQPLPEPIDRQTPLFGRDGALDSLGLVNLLVAVEQAVEDELGIVITIADEKAFSRQNSPFQTLGSLADYVDELVGAAAT